MFVKIAKYVAERKNEKSEDNRKLFHQLNICLLSCFWGYMDDFLSENSSDGSGQTGGGDLSEFDAISEYVDVSKYHFINFKK